MLAGSTSIKLSHNVNACNWDRFPTVSGMSVNKFPPSDRTLNLCTQNKITNTNEYSTKDSYTFKKNSNKVKQK